MKCKKTYKKYSPAKLLLTVTFVIALSFFGFVSNIYTPQKKVTQTELVVSNKINTLGWTDSFHKNSNLKTFFKPNVAKNYNANILLAYNKLTKVKLDYITLQYSLITFPLNYFRLKTIPQSSKENDFISLVG